ncbi:hypothetical protein BDP27DRAFT_1364126 [Rhodocollybia butyracea]|uniref:Uncharacterized protein n=1 Tax=Rhodocollybia butyracea TaxID=206335 RepID=A0A9P5U726_9AGAR|nr:hypothetical protein BDP27DRAFT_1364126 [Rhodocollybia butyracea]
MESALHTFRMRSDTEKDSLGGKEKANQAGDEKGVKTPRTTRYKDRFTVLRDKYEQVVAQQQNYHRDLDTANTKMKKMQEEIDLLLEALMPTTPPAPSTSEPGVYYNRAHAMDVELERDHVPLTTPLPPMLSMHHENTRSRIPQANGKTNGNITNGTHPYSVESEQDRNPHYMPRGSNGRIPIS